MAASLQLMVKGDQALQSESHMFGEMHTFWHCQHFNGPHFGCLQLSIIQFYSCDAMFVYILDLHVRVSIF